jgi:hypothetical protein
VQVCDGAELPQEFRFNANYFRLSEVKRAEADAAEQRMASELDALFCVE